VPHTTTDNGENRMTMRLLVRSGGEGFEPSRRRGRLRFADGVLPGSTEVVEAVGDDKQALLTVNTRVRFGPDAPEMDAPGARMYLFDEDGKIKIAHVLFFLS
jgi:hypothetical protein